MKKIILRILLVVLIIGMIGFYLYDLLINHTDPTKKFVPHFERSLRVHRWFD